MLGGVAKKTQDFQTLTNTIPKPHGGELPGQGWLQSLVLLWKGNEVASEIHKFTPEVTGTFPAAAGPYLISQTVIRSFCLLTPQSYK